MQLTELRFDRLPVGVRSAGSMEIPNSHQRGSHAVYEGKNHRFRQTFVIDSSWTGQEVQFKAKLTYQACNERICYPPITEKFEYRILNNLAEELPVNQHPLLAERVPLVRIPHG